METHTQTFVPPQGRTEGSPVVDLMTETKETAMSMKITRELIAFTPKMAGEVMDKHWRKVEKGEFRNRSVSMATIGKYMMDMRNDDWILTPESIIFDEDGNLAEGQHRLEACRRSGKTIQFYVERGWPRDTIHFIGGPKPRTLANLMQIDGVTNATNLASTVSTIGRIPFRGRTSPLSYQQSHHLLAEFGISQSIEAILKKSPLPGRDFVGRVVGPLAYYHTARPMKALAFAESLFNFQTTKNSPVALYLGWIKSGSHRGKGHSTERHMAGFCGCLHAWDENNEIQRVGTTLEHIEWLANINPKIRDWVRSHVSSRHGLMYDMDLKQKKDV